MAACSMYTVYTVLPVSTEPTVDAGNAPIISNTLSLSQKHSTHAVAMYAGPHLFLLTRPIRRWHFPSAHEVQALK